jgi:hypothetical protein
VSLALSCRCAADTCEGTSSGAHGAQACAAQPETQWPWAQASGDMQLLPASHACGQDCKSFVAHSNAVHLGQACSTLVQCARHDHNCLREPCKAVIALNSCCITKPVCISMCSDAHVCLRGSSYCAAAGFGDSHSRHHELHLFGELSLGRPMKWRRTVGQVRCLKYDACGCLCFVRRSYYVPGSPRLDRSRCRARVDGPLLLLMSFRASCPQWLFDSKACPALQRC